MPMNWSTQLLIRTEQYEWFNNDPRTISRGCNYDALLGIQPQMGIQAVWRFRLFEFHRRRFVDHGENLTNNNIENS